MENNTEFPTGYLDLAVLQHSLPNFDETYAAYMPNKQALELLKTVTEPTLITVIIGTWCPDCYREVPRLLNLLNAIGNANLRAEFIGVDRQKQDPQGVAAQYEFSRIPTLIIQQNKVQQDSAAKTERGRIIEQATHTLEEDLVAILQL